MKIMLLVLGVFALLFGVMQFRSASRMTTTGEAGWAMSSVLIGVGPFILGVMAILAAFLVA